MKTRRINISELRLDPANARQHDERNLEAIKGSLARFGQQKPIVVDADGVVVAGNGTVEAARTLGWEQVDVVGTELVGADRTAYAIADNRTAELAAWDKGSLAAVLAGLKGDADISELVTGFTPAEIEQLIASGSGAGGNGGHASLADRFGVPPFSVLDARQGYWQDRKRAWLALGIQSEVGRGDNTAPAGSPRPATKLGSDGRTRRGDGYGRVYDTQHRLADGTLLSAQTDTSVFDPVLCELAYRWFCPPDGAVLDPFAGGSVRGIVASCLGRSYTGIDLRAEQVEANVEQAESITPDSPPSWIVGDSRHVQSLAPGDYDLLFTCPPYADLEVYSDDPADLSTLKYDEFLFAYRQIIAESAARLRDDRFACFVVADLRDPEGSYRNFVSDTITAFLDAGLRLYNEAVLVTALGSLPIRAGKPFSATRKLGKTHQNVLVFVKGDARRATAACGPVEVQLRLDDEGSEVSAA